MAARPPAMYLLYVIVDRDIRSAADCLTVCRQFSYGWRMTKIAAGSFRAFTECVATERTAACDGSPDTATATATDSKRASNAMQAAVA